METEFIYWAHHTPIGIKIEEISGMDTKSGKVWLEMAKQIYCENGPDGYRELGHFPNGAPFVFGMAARISMTHTNHFLAVATLPKTPETDLAVFTPRTAMGIDAERFERAQVIKVREKFLSDAEMKLIPADNLKMNIIAWTCKEALYKAAMTDGMDFRNDITIERLPEIDKMMIFPGAPAPILGKAHLTLSAPDSKHTFEMEMYSYESEGCCVTIAYSPKCAKFGRKRI